MNEAAMIVGALLSPLAPFGLLLWLAHLEDTLERDVNAAQREPAPPPILSVPTRADDGEREVPAQRPTPEVRRPEPAEGAVTA